MAHPNILSSVSAQSSLAASIDERLKASILVWSKPLMHAAMVDGCSPLQTTPALLLKTILVMSGIPDTHTAKPAIMYSKTLLGNTNRDCALAPGGTNNPMSALVAALTISSGATGGSNRISSNTPWSLAS